MNILQCCPTCDDGRSPLLAITTGHEPTRLECRICKGQWLSRLALEKETSLEFTKRIISVMENQERVKKYPCIVCPEQTLLSVYPLFRYPVQEDYGVIQKVNPRWSNVPSYCEINFCPDCYGSWIKADDILKLPVLL